MAVFQWVLMCHNVIDEPERGGQSIIGIFDQIEADKFPAEQIDTRYIVTMWRGKPNEEFDLSILIGVADGTFPAADTGKTRVRFTQGGIMVRQDMRGLILPKAGLYNCTIKADGKRVHSFTIEAFLKPN